MGGVELDKQQTNTIKIKINGKERKSYGQKKDQQPESAEEIQSPAFPVTSWEEKVMAEKEVAASSSRKEDEFSWVLPEDDGEVFEDDPKVVVAKKPSAKQKGSPYFSSFKKNSLSGYPFKQYAVTVVMAIVLGVSFGFIALNFISNDDLPASFQPDGSDTEPAAASPDSKSGDKAANPAQASTDIQMYFAQIGKFSSKDGADATVSDLKSKGFPAISVEESGSFFVYGGVGNEKKETDGLSNVYLSNAIEPWSGKKAAFSLKSSEDASALINHLKSLITLSSSAVVSPSDEIGTKSEAILKELNKLKPKDESLAAMKENLSDASTLLKEDASEKTGWAAQQKLMDLLASLK
ncbi:hypothetical protein [Metabacillus idriensis]|uniref:hypothetical protein n=1 Tax=Metabacillus idriensis TaxID=324768 RepID=UPI0017490A5A|nr:hypothetical protein [Metabacillus idriensis]